MAERKLVVVLVESSAHTHVQFEAVLALAKKAGEPKNCTRVAERAFPQIKVTWRQPGDFRLYPTKVALAILLTAQIPDTVFYEDRTFSVAGVNGNGLFTPEIIGLAVQMMSTACWRGYHCQYTIRDGILYITRLTVGLTDEDDPKAENGVGPVVFGHKPRRESYEYEDIDGNKGTDWGDRFFDGFFHPVAYTGGLLIGDDFIREMYVHIGFHPAYKFREVFELIFEDGVLSVATDRSTQMAEFREMIAKRPLSPSNPNDKKAIENWIENAFSLDYRM